MLFRFIISRQLLRAWPEFSLVCLSLLCVTCGSLASSPELELLNRFCWTDLTVTQSSSAVWKVDRVRLSPSPCRLHDTHHINKSWVTTSSRAGMAGDENWDWFAGAFIACIVRSRGPGSYGSSFPILIVAAADYQIVKEQSNSLCVWVQRASGG